MEDEGENSLYFSTNSIFYLLPDDKVSGGRLSELDKISLPDYALSTYSN